jgi:membrane protein DedA with SNARE-associated domain
MGHLGVVDMLLQQYSYAALLLILFLDSAGVPWPTEATLVLAGAVSAHTARIHPLLAILSALGGAAVGSSLSYYLGRKMGPSLMQRIAGVFRLTPQHLAKVDEWFAKYGHRAVFVGRMVPFVRNLCGYPAGVAAMPFGKYLLYSLAGYGLYISVALGLGYGGGRLAYLFKQVEYLLWILVPVAAFVLYWKWGRTWVAKRRGKG